MRYTIFAIIVVAIFTIFVTVFSATANAKEVRVLPKWVWVALCLFVPVVGGVLYLTLGRPIGTTDDQSYGFGRSGRTRTVAPDDDPQFLRDLAERLKREADEGENDKK